MRTNLDQARLELDQDMFLRMADAKGAIVVCLEGCLWITRDGSVKDIQLDPGQSYEVEDATPVVVSGFEPSAARILWPAVESRHAWWRWLALAPRLSRPLEQRPRRAVPATATGCR